MHRVRIAIVGSGKMAGDAARLVLGMPGLQLALCLYGESDSWSRQRLPALLAPHGVPCAGCVRIRDAGPRAALERAAPDLILSVNNFSIFPADMLRGTWTGILNFHNGPLPDYRGLNIPSWVIFNRETRHGVTWHLADESIDTGPIVAQRLFDVDPRETAISLTFKCIASGLEILPALLGQLQEGPLPSRPQARSEGRYYSRRDVPHDGVIDLEWPIDVLDSFLRAMDFHPFPSPYARLRVELAPGHWISAERGEVVADAPMVGIGSVLKEHDGMLEIAVRAGRLTLFDVAGPAE